MKKAIITAGSRGIGKSISDSLREICDDVIATSSKELDTFGINGLDYFNNHFNKEKLLNDFEAILKG